MLPPRSRFSIALLLLISSCVAPFVHSSRVQTSGAVHQKYRSPLFQPPNEAQKADFAAWVQREGSQFQLKKDSFQKATTTVADSIGKSSELDAQTWIVVDQNGYGQFTKVQDAVNSIERDQERTQRITIQINPGTYYEQVVIAKNLPYLTLQGGGRDITIIENAATKEQAGNDIDDATVAVSAPHFIARNITIKNSAPPPASGAVGQQATALYVTGDMCSFFGCSVIGAQDTLYDHAGRHYYEECFIQGSIDFIYGDAKSFYKNSELNVIPVTTNSLTAQKRTSESDDTGFVFVDCAVTGAGRVYLGRAWGTYSRVIFATTWLSDFIIPEGWQDWSDPSRDWTVYYGEYNCFGPGANTNGRVAWSKQLSYEEAQPFLTLSYVDGESWIYG